VQVNTLYLRFFNHEIHEIDDDCIFWHTSRLTDLFYFPSHVLFLFSKNISNAGVYPTISRTMFNLLYINGRFSNLQGYSPVTQQKYLPKYLPPAPFLLQRLLKIAT